MKKALLFVCLLAAMAFASAKSYTVSFLVPATIGGTELGAGDYRFELQDQKIVIRHGRKTTEANVKVETSDAKYSTIPRVRYNMADGKNKVEEIQVGGTNMKLVVVVGEGDRGPGVRESGETEDRRQKRRRPFVEGAAIFLADS